MTTTPHLRVLVVDDSALNRDELLLALGCCEGVKVVGTAKDGSQALRMAAELRPDVITLDLEMPGLNGFDFLRLLPGVWPAPVIVVSGHSSRRGVLRALELGAIDFVQKPKTGAERRSSLPATLSEKFDMVRSLTPTRTGPLASGALTAPRSPTGLEGAYDEPPRYLLALVASTGGPTALAEVLSNLDHDDKCAVVIAQHMPKGYTGALAERLNHSSKFRVAEGGLQTPLVAGSALLCPGHRCMEVVRRSGSLRVETCQPGPSDRYVPSADRLLASIAATMGRRAIAVVLTGMGDDGAVGANKVVEEGGLVLVESEETAIVHGMPGATARLGIARRVLPLHDIASYLNDFMRS